MRSALNVALQGVMGSSGRGSVLLSWRMPVYHLEMVPSRFLFANSNVFFFPRCASWNPGDSPCIDSKHRVSDVEGGRSTVQKQKNKGRILKRMVTCMLAQRGRGGGSGGMFFMCLFLIFFHDRGLPGRGKPCESSLSLRHAFRIVKEQGVLLWSSQHRFVLL